MLMLGYDLKIAIFIYIFVSISMHGRCYSFEIRPGPADRPGTHLNRRWNRAGLKKK